jgi:putative oxidoreductase
MMNEKMCEKKCGTHPCMKACGLLALRLVIAIIFIYSGYFKLANHTMVAGMFGGLGLVPSGFLAWFVGLVELVGGVMVLLGVFAGYAAVPLAIIMVVAMLTAHRGGKFQDFFVPLTLLGGLLSLMGTGAGRYRLVKTECHCAACKGMESGKEGGCCGGKGACGCGDKEIKK